MPDEEKKIFATLMPALNEYKPMAEKMMQESFKDTEGKTTALQVAKKGREKSQALDKAIDELANIQIKIGEEINKTTDELYASTCNLTIAVIVAAFALSMGLGILLSRSLSKPIGQLEQLAGKIAKGDLAENAPNPEGSDKISSLNRSVHQMVLNLRNFVSKVQQGAQAVAASAQQISASSGCNSTSSRSIPCRQKVYPASRPSL